MSKPQSFEAYPELAAIIEDIGWTVTGISLSKWGRLLTEINATIDSLRRERDEALDDYKRVCSSRGDLRIRAESAEAENARLLNPSDEAIEVGAYMLAKNAATWFGERVPETFDLTMSKTILKPAYSAVCKAAQQALTGGGK